MPSDPNTSKDPRKIINYFSKNYHKLLKVWGFGVLGNACNEKYLKKVLLGKVYCPKYEDIKMLPCPRPPSKTVLYEKFKAIMPSKKFTIAFDEKHLPDAKWLLAVIATLNPTNEIF